VDLNCEDVLSWLKEVMRSADVEALRALVPLEDALIHRCGELICAGRYAADTELGASDLNAVEVGDEAVVEVYVECEAVSVIELGF
jgi:hypothetical protein